MKSRTDWVKNRTDWVKVEAWLKQSTLFVCSGLLTELLHIGARANGTNNQVLLVCTIIASQLGNTECIRVFGVSPNILYENKSGRRTPRALMTSAVVLLNLGAEPNATNGIWQTPVLIACMYGYRKLLLLLISRKTDIAMSDIGEQTPMVVIALVFGHMDYVGILLANHVGRSCLSFTTQNRW